MHKEILSPEQIKLLPLIKSVSQGFGLVGGTAIALHLGHRRSIDFDLFSVNEFNNFEIQKKIRASVKIEEVFVDRKDEYTLLVDGVKITFFYYPFKINFSDRFDDVCLMADLLTLAALKAYSLGRRAKWKDYIDLYFIMKNGYEISNIIIKAKEIFENNFNEKLFRSQLSYFKDIDQTEEIIYLQGKAVDDLIIEKELINFSLLE